MTKKRQIVTACFDDLPGSKLDLLCRKIFKQHGGEFVHCGTTLAGPAAGERDVEYRVPAKRVEAARAALQAAGFRLEENPNKWD
jgi:hypothetical protein